MGNSIIEKDPNMGKNLPGIYHGQLIIIIFNLIVGLHKFFQNLTTNTIFSKEPKDQQREVLRNDRFRTRNEHDQIPFFLFIFLFNNNRYYSFGVSCRLEYLDLFMALYFQSNLFFININRYLIFVPKFRS